MTAVAFMSPFFETEQLISYKLYWNHGNADDWPMLCHTISRVIVTLEAPWKTGQAKCDVLSTFLCFFSWIFDSKMLSFRNLSETELHAGPNFQTRPAPIHESRDPTRRDPLIYATFGTRPDPIRRPINNKKVAKLITSWTCIQYVLCVHAVCLKKTSPTFLAVTRESIVGFS